MISIEKQIYANQMKALEKQIYANQMKHDKRIYANQMKESAENLPEAMGKELAISGDAIVEESALRWSETRWRNNRGRKP